MIPNALRDVAHFFLGWQEVKVEHTAAMPSTLAAVRVVVLVLPQTTDLTRSSQNLESEGFRYAKGFPKDRDLMWTSRTERTSFQCS